jgi:hypothetical protein
MPFTRKTLVTVLAVLVLVTVGVGHRDRAEARTWIIDTQPTADTSPTSGEPDVGHLLSQPPGTQSSQTTRVTPAGQGGSAIAQLRLAPSVRWLGWIWLNRNLGMGL